MSSTDFKKYCHQTAGEVEKGTLLGLACWLASLNWWEIQFVKKRVGGNWGGHPALASGLHKHVCTRACTPVPTCPQSHREILFEVTALLIKYWPYISYILNMSTNVLKFSLAITASTICLCNKKQINMKWSPNFSGTKLFVFLRKSNCEGVHNRLLTTIPQPVWLYTLLVLTSLKYKCIIKN